MERPPHRLPSSKSAAMEVVMTHDAAAGAPDRATLERLQAGDVVAFHMSHREAWSYLRKAKIQKLPYDLCRFGHIALVVPDPDRTDAAGGPKLLQVAMKQAVNADEGLDYLKDKSWFVYRPPEGSVDAAKLHDFSRRVLVTASDKKKAYDYSGAIGLVNAPWQPAHPDEIGSEYSCATLVVAGLHYAGFSLDAVHRKGILDIVTPRQVVESRAAHGAGSTRTR